MNFHIKCWKQEALALNLYVATGIGGHSSSERKIKQLCIDLEAGIGGKVVEKMKKKRGGIRGEIAKNKDHMRDNIEAYIVESL